MAISDFGGKVLGKPIELVAGDLQNKADVGLGIAQEMVRNISRLTRLWPGQFGGRPGGPESSRWKRTRSPSRRSPRTSELTGKACSPNGAHWVYDNILSPRVRRPLLSSRAAKSWYFITADYAFGHSLEANATDFVKALGGTVVGSVRHPTGSSDFSSFILQAQSSKAQVIGVANAGADTINTIKQAAGIRDYGARATGGRSADAGHRNSCAGTERPRRGCNSSKPFIGTRTKRVRFRTGSGRSTANRRPKSRPGTYGAAMHYLKAVQAAGTDEATAVMAKMKSMPINDFMTKNGRFAKTAG